MDFQKFAAHARRHGFMFNNRFLVTIPLPTKVQAMLDGNNVEEDDMEQLFKKGFRIATILTGGKATSERGLQIMCSSAEFPGLNIETSSGMQNGHKITIATGSSKDKASFSFMISADAYEKKILDAWRDFIVDRRNKKVAYYDDYVVDIEVSALGLDGYPTYTVRYLEAWPSTFSKLNLEKRVQTMPQTYSLSFTYKRFDDDTQASTNNFLQNSSLYKLGEDLMKGDLESAAYRAREVMLDVKNGTFSTKQAQDAYNVLSDAINGSIGVGASDIEGIISGFKADVIPSIANSVDRQSLSELSDRLIDGFI
ncbi:hypothetical protein Kuja_0350 [Vibrio phage vB_VchM_Kuja]|uniref:Baseplate tail tube initiator n=1 Tax=Vibrio phage vB_VchM_Kuja TaxID=2686437 RepID=A0A6B9JAQ0_9CAUD|nr:tail tube protein [Vibrio phage vB_VchM_Kuja]QGZ16026.1 hypothetical protein Kuja_0350 [Vibrio phage vB_VchM_Kuja]